MEAVVELQCVVYMICEKVPSALGEGGGFQVGRALKSGAPPSFIW